MACARRLLMLLYLLPVSLAWRPKTVFHLHKPNGHACSKHSECRSRCCVLSISGSELTCRPMTIFLQCQPWRKPNGSRCTNDNECQSRCCLAPTEVSHRRCVPQRGILVQCLLLERLSSAVWTLASASASLSRKARMRPPKRKQVTVTGKLILEEEPVRTREKLSLDLVPAFRWELSLRGSRRSFWAVKTCRCQTRPSCRSSELRRPLCEDEPNRSSGEPAA